MAGLIGIGVDESVYGAGGADAGVRIASAESLVNRCGCRLFEFLSELIGMC